MPRKFLYALAVAALTAVLAWAGWRGVPGNPATLISRVDVVATVLILTGLPWPVQRRFGELRSGWAPRAARIAGYLIVLALVLLKADAEQVEYATSARRPGLGGLWVGEIVFLVVLAAYVAGLLAMTARHSPASPRALAIGGLAGVVLGISIYVLRPLEGPLHTSSGLLTVVYVAARLLAVPLVLGGAIAAGVTAARHSAHRGKSSRSGSTAGRPQPRGAKPRGAKRPGAKPAGALDDHARAGQGVIAGLCAGAGAALLVSVLGISTIALAPRDASGLRWTLPSQGIQAGPIYQFEVSVTQAAAGYLLVLVLFPLLGAGLGAWGGLYGADRPGQSGGNGGGGPRGPEPEPTPPPGGLALDEARRPTAADIRKILDSPAWSPTPGQSADGPGSVPAVPETAPGRERTPV